RAQPLIRRLGEPLRRSDLENTIMLEVLTRPYYGNKARLGGRTSEVAGCTFVVAERAGSCVVSCAVSFEALGSALRGLAELATGEHTIDADIYLAWEKQPESFDAMAAALHEVVSAHPLPNQVRRLTTTVAGR